MKKCFIAVALFSLVAFAAKAQTSSDVVDLVVKLYPIQTLVINPDPEHKTVELEYKLKNDYAAGVSATRANHMTVYSTGGFKVSVKSLTDQLTGTTGSIATNTIQIVPTAGSAPIAGTVYTPRNLGAAEATIIESNLGGVDKTYSIEYKGAGVDAYLNHYNNAENPTVFSTTVTYTIVPM